MKTKLFKLLEKQEAFLHETFGFSKNTQLAFEPLYEYCKGVKKRTL